MKDDIYFHSSSLALHLPHILPCSHGCFHVFCLGGLAATVGWAKSLNTIHLLAIIPYIAFLQNLWVGLVHPSSLLEPPLDPMRISNETNCDYAESYTRGDVDGEEDPTEGDEQKRSLRHVINIASLVTSHQIS